jgi:hypothetical protein
MKMIMNNTLRKLYCFVCICIYALAAIGGIAYLFYDQHGVFAVAAIAVTAMATPYLIERIKELTA